MLVNKKKMESMADSMSDHSPIEGRSLWQDAMNRFMNNKAALVSLIVLVAMIVTSFIGPYLSPWDFETIDWALLGNAAEMGAPSIENGHYFGTDDLGRDQFARVMVGTQSSLMVGIVGTAVAVVVGVLYGAVSGYFGGRLDNVMMRFVDI